MNIEKQIREDHHAQLTVQVEADRLESMKRRAAGKLARRVKIPGFRPGKAPYPVIVRQIGEAAILEEAVEILVEEIYPDVIKEADIHPYGPGKLEDIASTDPVTLVFSVPLEAETTLGDFRSIQKAYEPASVSDEEVANVLRDLQERNAIIEPVERPAQIGDQVTISLHATIQDDEGQHKDLIPERSSSVIIRPAEDETQENAHNTPTEWPFPGFSHHLIGLAVNDEKDLEYTYPEDSEYKTLQGVTAHFWLKVESVKSRQLPSLDDEFAKTIGEYDTLDALKADIRQSLETQAREAYNESYDEEILSAAIEQTTFRYPPEMVEREIETVINELQRRLEQQGMDIDLYLKARGIDMEQLKEELKPVAEGRIKRALFLVEFGKAENIEVKPEELEKEAFSTMDYLYNTLPERDSRKLAKRDVYTNIVGNVLADMLSRRSLERFREICSGGLSKEEKEEAEEDAEEITVVENELVSEEKQESSPAMTKDQPSQDVEASDISD